MKFGEFIKKLRKENALSMRAFAQKVGISLSTVYYIEANEKIPKFVTLRKISKAFDIPIKELAQYI